MVCADLATHQEIFPSGVTTRDLNSEVALAFQKIAQKKQLLRSRLIDFYKLT